MAKNMRENFKNNKIGEGVNSATETLAEVYLEINDIKLIITYMLKFRKMIIWISSIIFASPFPLPSASELMWDPQFL